MTEWFELINFAVAVGGVMIALMGLVFARIASHMDKWSRRFFQIFFAFLTGYVASDLISQISLELLGPGYSLLSRLAIFGESLFSSVLGLLLTIYLLHCTEKEWKKSPTLYIAGSLWFVYFALLVITQFTTFIYFVAKDNVYHRGAWYPILLTPPVLLMLLNLFTMVRRLSRLSHKQHIAFGIYLLLPLVCMIVQMLSYGLLLIVIGTSIAAMFLFVFILSEQTENYVRTREELAEQRASVSVLQLRPHFIYNTMTSIYYLCSQNPEKAQRLILDFNTYLRKNFTAIAKSGTIPFTEELEHTRAYLAVEQVRFEGKLFVEFDTPYTNFRLPPLTLQPIVENAVKHGVDPELEPLYVSIHTQETVDGIKITVEDNGPGTESDVSAESDRDHQTDGTHTALANIRERLEMTCAGTLEITQRDGGGTAVTITLPA